MSEKALPDDGDTAGTTHAARTPDEPDATSSRAGVGPSPFALEDAAPEDAAPEDAATDDAALDDAALQAAAADDAATVAGASSSEPVRGAGAPRPSAGAAGADEAMTGEPSDGPTRGEQPGRELAHDERSRSAQSDHHDSGSASSDDAEAALREAHAWQVSAEAVRSLPAEVDPLHQDDFAGGADSTGTIDPMLPASAGSALLTADGAAEGPAGGAADGSSDRPAGPGAAGSSATHHPGRPTGWSALGSALRPRATRAQVLAGVLCAVLGFAIVVQLRQNGDSTLSQLRQDDLVRLLDEASTRSDQLSREAADLQRERDQLVSGSNTRQAAIDAARRSAATQGILAGRLPAVGPGVRITLEDSGGSLRPITMLNMLEELRNAGAEAVQLNDQRIVASSSFTGSAGAVQLDGTTLNAPYVWLVIGDPDTIATALDIPGGAMAYVRNDGGTGSVDKLTEVHVDALHPVTDPRFATPAAVPGS